MNSILSFIVTVIIAFVISLATMVAPMWICQQQETKVVKSSVKKLMVENVHGVFAYVNIFLESFRQFRKRFYIKVIDFIYVIISLSNKMLPFMSFLFTFTNVMVAILLPAIIVSALLRGVSIEKILLNINNSVSANSSVFFILSVIFILVNISVFSIKLENGAFNEGTVYTVLKGGIFVHIILIGGSITVSLINILINTKIFILTLIPLVNYYILPFSLPIVYLSSALIMFLYIMVIMFREGETGIFYPIAKGLKIMYKAGILTACLKKRKEILLFIGLTTLFVLGDAPEMVLAIPPETWGEFSKWHSWEEIKTPDNRWESIDVKEFLDSEGNITINPKDATPEQAKAILRWKAAQHYESIFPLTIQMLTYVAMGVVGLGAAIGTFLYFRGPKNPPGDIAPSSGGAGDIAPSSGGAGDIAPSSGGAGDIAPSSGGAGDIAPSSGGARDIAPSSAGGGSLYKFLAWLFSSKPPSPPGGGVSTTVVLPVVVVPNESTGSAATSSNSVALATEGKGKGPALNSGKNIMTYLGAFGEEEVRLAEGLSCCKSPLVTSEAVATSSKSVASANVLSASSSNSVASANVLSVTPPKTVALPIVNKEDEAWLVGDDAVAEAEEMIAKAGLSDYKIYCEVNFSTSQRDQLLVTAADRREHICKVFLEEVKNHGCVMGIEELIEGVKITELAEISPSYARAQVEKDIDICLSTSSGILDTEFNMLNSVRSLSKDRDYLADKKILSKLIKEIKYGTSSNSEEKVSLLWDAFDVTTKYLDKLGKKSDTAFWERREEMLSEIEKRIGVFVICEKYLEENRL